MCGIARKCLDSIDNIKFDIYKSTKNIKLNKVSIWDYDEDIMKTANIEKGVLTEKLFSIPDIPREYS